MHMRLPLTTVCSALRLLTLAACLGVTLAHADAYDDALMLSRAGQHTEALAQIDSALAQRPSDPRLRFLKGLMYRQLQRTDDAMGVFTALTQDYPELPEPYNNLAVLHAAQGHLDQARSALETALRLNPDYATAHENLGDVYARLAAQAYARALQLDASSTTLASKQAALNGVFKTSPAPSPSGTR